MAQREYRNGAAARRGGRSRPGRKSGHPLRAAAIVVVAAIGLAGVVLWKVWPRASDFRNLHGAPVPRPTAPAVATPPSAGAASEGADNAGNYTFYDILPGNQAPRPLPANKAQELWWLQVAALKSASDADALRAKLTLLNYSAIVRPTPAGQPPLYRVRVGPYPDQAAAEAAEKTLAENKFDARPVKEAVIP